MYQPTKAIFIVSQISTTKMEATRKQKMQQPVHPTKMPQDPSFALNAMQRLSKSKTYKII